MKHYSLIQKNKAKNNLIWSIREFDTETKTIKFISTKTKNKKSALDTLYLYQQEQIKIPKGEKIDLKKSIQIWIDTISNTTSKGTLNQYKRYIKPLENYASDQSKDLKNISSTELNELYNKLTENASTPKKRYLHLVWKMFFNWAINIHQLNISNPIKAIKQPKKEKKDKDFWTLEELEKIIEKTTDKQTRLSFSFMAYAGLRISETINLKWEQINNNLSIKGKGNKTCVLPISNKLKNEIEFYKQNKCFKSEEKIFNITYSKISKELKKVCNEINLKGGQISPHRFRHSFASNLLRKGANIIAVSKLMRHETPTITLNTYAHIISTDLEKTINLIE